MKPTGYPLIPIFFFVIGVAFGYFLPSAPITNRILPVNDGASEHSSVSLADAINLLPKPETAIGGRKINETTFWVWAKADYPAPDARQEQSWVVNVQTKKAELAREREGVVMGASATINEWDERYFIVDWSSSWEGYGYESTDYFDRTSGRLAYTLTIVNGQMARINAGDKQLEFTLDPMERCVYEFDGEQTVQIVGLHVNDQQLLAFPKPYPVQCVMNDMSGEAFFPDFRFFVITEDEKGQQIIRLGMPEGIPLQAEMPLPDLDVHQLRYK